MESRSLLRSHAWILPLLVAAVAAAVVSASVFVYYNVGISATFVNPPVKLVAGSNAGQTDLGGNTIAVNIGQNKTSASIEIHPTYQKTYYLGVINITNSDTTTTYYAWLRLSTSSSLTPGEKITIHVIANNGTEVGSLTLSSTGTAATNTPISLGAGKTYRVDIEVVYPEGIKLPTSSQSFTLEIIYSPQNAETPP